MPRPRTQLFMLMSLDGKISTGDRDGLDFDQDFPKIAGVKEGLHQYYDIEKTTDINSFNTGRVMAKIGMNDKKKIEKIQCTFVIVDSSHLTATGVQNLCRRTRRLYLVTANKNHPAYKVQEDNLTIIEYKNKIDLVNLFKKLCEEYGMKRLTIQSGGTMNAELIRLGLVDKISVVVAPVIVGGKDTSTIVDGESLHTLTDIKKVQPLELVRATKLNNSYLHLIYKVKK